VGRLAGRFDGHLDRRRLDRLPEAPITRAGTTAAATERPALVYGPVEEDAALFEVHNTSNRWWSSAEPQGELRAVAQIQSMRRRTRVSLAPMAFGMTAARCASAIIRLLP